jgi:chaperonin cofactor prefoldin
MNHDSELAELDRQIEDLDRRADALRAENAANQTIIDGLRATLAQLYEEMPPGERVATVQQRRGSFRTV